MLKMTLALLLTGWLFACAGNIPAGATEDAGITLDAGPTLTCAATEACIQSNGADVCRTRCQMDAGTPCTAGETCTRRIVCCSGTACTAALADVCCPASGC
jgi:hypothetical protein